MFLLQKSYFKPILCLLVLAACITMPSAGIIICDNFQDWTANDLSISTGTALGITTPSVGNISLVMGPSISTWMNSNASVWTYAAFDSGPATTAPDRIYLLDSSQTKMAEYGAPSGISHGPNSRFEIKMIGMDPTLYINGVYRATFSCTGPDAPHCSINPSYLEIVDYTSSRTYDNIFIGSLSTYDRHVVGAFPSNWTIIKDLINPSAIGIYAWNNAGQSWTLKNSNQFYIDADTDSTDAVYSENFDIVNLNVGTVVNTTIIDSTTPRHQITYNITAFLEEAQDKLGTSSIYGQYYAQFRGYPNSRSYFWVMGSGATISWGQPSYPSGATATVSYSITSSYYDTTTYNYEIKILDAYGTVKKTQTVSGSTGSISFTMDSSTYADGVYYAELIAVKKSDSSETVMNYGLTEVNSYLAISGWVVDQNNTALQSAAVNVTQGTSTLISTSNASGYYSSSNNWLAGSEINATTSLSGYASDYNLFTPIGSDTITLNITLVNNNRTYSGVAIGGVVKDKQYGSTVPAATVYERINGTSATPASTTANGAGYYIFNGLVNGTTYDVWSQKTGYANSTIEQKLAVGV